MFFSHDQYFTRYVYLYMELIAMWCLKFFLGLGLLTSFVCFYIPVYFVQFVLFSCRRVLLFSVCEERTLFFLGGGCLRGFLASGLVCWRYLLV